MDTASRLAVCYGNSLQITSVGHQRPSHSTLPVADGYFLLRTISITVRGSKNDQIIPLVHQVTSPKNGKTLRSATCGRECQCFDLPPLLIVAGLPA